VGQWKGYELGRKRPETTGHVLSILANMLCYCSVWRPYRIC
jgi:hypothetical protein